MYRAWVCGAYAILTFMTTPHQVLYIHGGVTFPTHEEYLTFLRTKEITLDRLRATRYWKERLQDTLGSAYDVLAPRMPNGTNAVYAEWELWFSRILPVLNDGLILIGHSLGGVFLARYLSEHQSLVKLRATMLVAAPFREGDLGESLNGFLPPSDLSLLDTQGGDLFIYHSTDDPVVPFTHGELYAKALPRATFRTCEGMGHFNVESFPALEADLRALAVI